MLHEFCTNALKECCMNRESEILPTTEIPSTTEILSITEYLSTTKLDKVRLGQVRLGQDQIRLGQAQRSGHLELRLNGKFWISETSRDIKKAKNNHLNIFKSYVNFENVKGVAQKLSAPRPFVF